MAAKLGADFTPLLRQLEALAGPQVRRDLITLLSRTALTEVRRGFETGTGPTGAAWPPSIRVQMGLGGGGTLVDQRRLMGTFRAGVVETGFRLYPGMNTDWPSVRYIKTHQYGAVITPKRAKALRFKAGGWRDAEGATWRYAKRVEIPRRPMIPLDDAGNEYMPIRWERAFLDDAARVLAGFAGSVRD